MAFWVALGPRASAKNPNLALNWNCSGSYAKFQTAMKEKNWEAMVENGRKVVGQCLSDLDANDAVIMLGPMAYAYRQLGRPEDALLTAEQCLSAVRNAYPCRFQKAAALAELGRNAEARPLLKRFAGLSLTSTDPEMNSYAEAARKLLAEMDEAKEQSHKSKKSEGKEPPGDEHAKAGLSTGTGFFVSSDVAVTNNHVVDGCKSMETAAGHQPLTLIERDPINDLAVVRAPGKAPATLKLRATPAKLGEQILAFGYPLTGLLTSDGNLTTGVVTGLKGMRDNDREIQISAPVQPGNSGGAVVDGAGRVVGVVKSVLNGAAVAKVTGTIPQNVNFAVSLDRLTAFLEAQKVPYEKAPAAQSLKTEETADLAKRASLQIICGH